MRALPILAGLALLAACGGDGRAPDGDAKPNVVFISVDTVRADRTTPYGYPRDTTPALARMATEGTLFERAYAMSSWTLPSMSMLVTGEMKPLADQAVLPSHEPIAATLKAVGYRTGAFISNALLTPDYGYDRGVDRFAVVPPDPNVYWPSSKVFRDGIDWVEETDEDGSPFFLWLHPTDPHWPYSPEGGVEFEGAVIGIPGRAEATRSLEQSHAAGVEETDPAQLTGAAWRRIEHNRAKYDSEVLQFDRELQRLIAWLEERDELDSTIIVVTSDHGEGLWQRAINPDQRKLNPIFAPLYDSHGAQLYEEQVRVPLVFRGPGVPSGVRVAEPVDLVDVVPSILSLANARITRTYDGEPLFENGEAIAPSQDPIVAVCSRSRSITVDGRWRLHEPRPHRMKHRAVDVRLYDLDNDPLELSPIDDPDRIAELQARLQEWHDEHAPDGTGDLEISEERWRLLFSLGYGGEAEHVKAMKESLEEKAQAEKR
ncbi:MAG: sulfatase [Planctomycetota bacterium]